MKPTVQNPDEAARIVRARINLLITQPWFGQLALNLKVVEDTTIKTMATDGTRLIYNPNWTRTQDDEVLVGTIAHESLHCGLRHMYRCRGREMPLWNEATDYSINPLILANGLKLREGALVDARYDGLAAETIYARRLHERDEKRRQEQQNAQNDQKEDDDADEDADDTGDDEVDDDSADDSADDAADDGAPDDLLPAPDPSKDGTPGDAASGTPTDDESDDEPMTEVDWQIAADQAEMSARKRGLMPADAERAFDETLESRVDWRETLRQFIDQTMPSDYRWSQPNRRYISSGLYLPAVVKESIPRLLVALDTSGSIDQRLLATFASELTAIMLECRPAAIDVLSCDARVQSVETFTPDDGAITPHPRGGGGTAFQPVFDWVETQDEPPAAILYLTDLEGDEPTEPDVPVLWITPEYVTRQGLFGETIRIPATR